ncbi:hypothetical protein CIHG_01369, partial [Coccidioides immitis H538.4]
RMKKIKDHFINHVSHQKDKDSQPHQKQRMVEKAGNTKGKYGKYVKERVREMKKNEWIKESLSKECQKDRVEREGGKKERIVNNYPERLQNLLNQRVRQRNHRKIRRRKSDPGQFPQGAKKKEYILRFESTDHARTMHCIVIR